MLLGAALVAGACERTPPPIATAPPAPTTASELVADMALSVDQKLARRLALTPTEVDRLRGVADESTLVSLMLNPGTPPELLRAFAVHPAAAVRIAVASNLLTPVEVLLSLRESGVGRPINRALAMNASTPIEVLLDMRAKGEAGDVSLAANPALPVEVMRDIARRGDEVARERLLGNAALPADLREVLARPVR